MSLDFAVMKADGTIDRHVPVDANSHWEIVLRARQRDLKLILTCSDYYEDATIAEHQLPSLSREVTLLQSSGGLTAPSTEFLSRLSELIAEAANRGQPIEVISD